MERIILNNNGGTVSLTPIGSSTSQRVSLEDIINAMQFSGKYIAVKGRIYLSDTVAYACDGDDAAGIGADASPSIPFYDLVKSIKTFGLQNVTKVGSLNLQTRNLIFY